jgi:hypothetical protein
MRGVIINEGITLISSNDFANIPLNNPASENKAEVRIIKINI